MEPSSSHLMASRGVENGSESFSGRGQGDALDAGLHGTAASLAQRVEALEAAVGAACLRDGDDEDEEEYFTCAEDDAEGFESGPPSHGSGAPAPPSRGLVALSRDKWRSPDASIFLVRDEQYLNPSAGGHKQPSASALFDLVALDLLKTDPDALARTGASGIAPPPENVARCPDAYLLSPHGQRRLRSCPMVFILNIMVPGPTYTCLVTYWACPKGSSWEAALRQHREATDGEIESVRMLLEGDDEYPDTRFKLAPIVEKGPWAVRAAVGGKPCLLGTKVRVPIHRSPTRISDPGGVSGSIPPYVEVDVDVGSSTVARHVVGLAHGASKMLTVHLGVSSEPKVPEELPERILACVTLDSVDMAQPSLVNWPLVS